MSDDRNQPRRPSVSSIFSNLGGFGRRLSLRGSRPTSPTSSPSVEPDDWTRFDLDQNGHLGTKLSIPDPETEGYNISHATDNIPDIVLSPAGDEAAATAATELASQSQPRLAEELSNATTDLQCIILAAKCSSPEDQITCLESALAKHNLSRYQAGSHAGSEDLTRNFFSVRCSSFQDMFRCLQKKPSEYLASSPSSESTRIDRDERRNSFTGVTRAARDIETRRALASIETLQSLSTLGDALTARR